MQLRRESGLRVGGTTDTHLTDNNKENPVAVTQVPMKNVSVYPPDVAAVPKDLLRNFPHTKRVGQYLLGRTLGEGSFAKVKEGLHILTGEKV